MSFKREFIHEVRKARALSPGEGKLVAAGVLVALMLSGCSDPFEEGYAWNAEPHGGSAASDGDDEGPSGGTNADSSTGDEGSTSAGEDSDGAPPADSPPVITDFRVGGSVNPDVFSTPGPVIVYAELEDDDELPPTVVFFESREGGPWVEVASVSAAPYTYTIGLTGADFSNGARRVRAVARELPAGEDLDEVGPIEFTVAMPSGGAQWWSATRESNPGDSEALDITVDGAGDLYVTGSTSRPVGGTAIWTAKYSVTGQLQWEREVQRADKDLSRGHGVAVDSAGQTYVVGSIQELDQQLSYGPPTLYVARYDEHGELVWEGAGSEFALRAARDVVIGEGGDLILTGHRYVSNFRHDVFLMIIDEETGEKRFSLQFDGGANRRDHGEGIALLPDHNVVVVGWLSDADDRKRAFARKYDLASADKNVLWKWDSTANGDGEQDKALAVAALPGGSVVIAGTRFTEPSGTPRRVALELSTEGVEGGLSLDAWNTFGPEEMRGVAANAQGRFVLAGVESHPNNGRVAWAQYYLNPESYAWIEPGAEDGLDELGRSFEANAVALGPYGTVALAGFVTDEDDPDRHHILIQTYFP
jgi:hypothetical protein